MSYRFLEKVCAYYYDAAVRRRVMDRHGSIAYLSSGVNHLPAPSALRHQFAREFENNHFYRSYPGQAGGPLFLCSVLFELKHRVSRSVHRALTLGNLCVSVGGTGGLYGCLDYLSHRAGVKSALVLGMNYSYFSLCCERWGIQYRVVNSEEPGRILPLPGEVEALLDEFRPDLVIVTQPTNPSGEVYTQEEMSRLVSLIREHDLWLLVDEVPNMANPSESEVPHVLGCPGLDRLPEKFIFVNSFSKSRSLAGHRLGYVLGNPALVESLRKANEYTHWSPSNVGSSALAIDMLLRTLIGTSQTSAVLPSEAAATARVRQFRHYVGLLAPYSEDYSRPVELADHFGDTVNWMAMLRRQDSDLRAVRDTYQRNWSLFQERIAPWLVTTIPARHGFNHCIKLDVALPEREFCLRAFEEAGLDFYTESVFSELDDDTRSSFWLRVSCAIESAIFEEGVSRLECFLQSLR